MRFLLTYEYRKKIQNPNFLFSFGHQHFRAVLLLLGMVILPLFLPIFTSLFLLGFTSKNKELKSILVIPVFAINFVTFIYRVFQLEQWLPQRKTESFWQKILAVVLIPAFLLFIFFCDLYTRKFTFCFAFF